MSLYVYKAFGLHIQSEFEIQNLLKTDYSGHTDIEIKYGKVRHPDLPSKIDKYFSFSDNKTFYLNVPNVAVYSVFSGRLITIQKNVECNCSNTVELFLLGSVFGALMHQRGTLLLHGCTTAKDNYALVFIGPSGIGKTTVSTGLYKKYNYKLIADDVSPIEKLNNGYYIIPSYPGAKLWKDSLEYLGENLCELEKIRPELEKYRLYFHNDFSHDLIPIKKVYLLTYSSDEGYYIETINKSFEKFKILRQNVYRYDYIHKLGKGRENLEQLIDLTKSIDIKKISRPRNNSNIDKLLNLIHRDLN